MQINVKVTSAYFFPSKYRLISKGTNSKTCKHVLNRDAQEYKYSMLNRRANDNVVI